MPQQIVEKLKKLDFSADSLPNELLFVGNDYHNQENISFEQILVLEKAKVLGACAVYFRQIEGRGFVPQIVIFDNSQNDSSLDLLSIHKKIWSSDLVPLYYVFDDKDVKIYNSRKPIPKKPHLDPLETIPLVAKLQEKYNKFSASFFENGSFWELPETNKEFSADNSSHSKLIAGLKKIRTEFIRGQNEAICNKLLVLSILVKYLEERNGENDKGILPEGYFKKYDGATNFCDVLRKGKCLDLFKDLSVEVNGGIFKLTDIEQDEISSINHSGLADFLDANKEDSQYVIWRLYDFNYLTVELISRIYEEFIPKRKDIAYTPSHLVNFIIDESMPIDSPPSKRIKLIDVSCGSGIFLVAAFKRLIQWWQQERYRETGKIVKPNIATLKSILSNSIYGVDLEGEAVRLAKFSLTVAFCDMLNPARMWEELTEHKLLDLKNNLIEQDFFDFIETEDKFDYVIGNPPFNPPFDEPDERKKYWTNIKKKVLFEFDPPDNHIALGFLQKAMGLLKKDALLAMIMPSGALLYNNTLSHRKWFWGKYNIPQIFDFSCLNSVLFQGKNIPISVFFAQNKTPDSQDILHAVIKRTNTSKEKLYFEIDKYDLYYVPKEIAQTEQLIWKANLFGGDYVFSLLKKMENLRSLGEYLKQKKKRKWVCGEGYIIGDGGKKAPHLTGKKRIPTESFITDKITKDDLETEYAKSFYRTAERNKEIFKAPHVLIKETPNLPIVFKNDEDIIFKNEIIGIHTPDCDKPELQILHENIKTNKILYGMLLLSQSSRAGVSRSIKSVLKKDIMALPYPEDMKCLKLSLPEKILSNDIINYYSEQLAIGETAQVNVRNAKPQEIRDFGKIFCDSLNSIYGKEGKQFYSLDVIESDSFICYPFAYGEPKDCKNISKKKTSEIEKGNLSSLIDNPKGSILYKRIITLYAKDIVYLIKPKTLKYWLKSIALRDASEVFEDLISSGY